MECKGLLMMAYINTNLSKVFGCPERVYLCIAFFCGLAFMFVVPPCSVPDEPAHLIRVFRVAQGDLFSASQTRLPSLDAYCDLCEVVGMDHRPRNLNKQWHAFLTEPGAALTLQDKGSSYYPVAYLPAAAAVKLLSFFQTSTAVYLYSARFATFITSLLITWLAIRSMPFGRWIMLVFALLPMRLYLMGSFSPDALTAALSMFWIALVIKNMMSEAAFKTADLLLLVLSGLAMAFTKPVYAMLLALIFVIPIRKIIGSASIVFKVSVICVALVAIMGVGLRAKEKLPNLTNAPVAASVELNTGQEELATGLAGSLYFTSAIDPSAQLAYLLDSPARLLTVLWNGYRVGGAYILKSVVGLFGWFNVFLSIKYYWLGCLLLVMAMFLDKAYAPGVRFRIIVFLLFIASLVIIPLGAYLIWTPVGTSFFHGVHGRYFVPFLPLLLLSLGGSLNLSAKKLYVARAVSLMILLLLLLASLVQIYQSYYLLPTTQGYLELQARSNANGVAYLYVKELDADSKRSHWRHQGTTSLIQSDKPLNYQFSLPEMRASAIMLVFASAGRLELKIDSMQIRKLDNKLVKRINPSATKKNLVGSICTTSSREGDDVSLVVNLNRRLPQATVTYDDIQFELKRVSEIF